MKKNISILLKNIAKVYEVHYDKPTLVENVIKNKKKQYFEALKDINLTILEGENVGIIGSNGSGKTTLLKIITGITSPNKGTIKVRGKIVSLIDIGAGFNEELTGRENIFLNGLVIGMSKKEIVNKMEDIINFADIGEFIDLSLYTYSTGMRLRLGFSIAIHSDPDILILDEGIAAGDETFRKKSGEKIKEFFKTKKTILIASHWFEYLRVYCNRIIWIEKGNLLMDGGLEILDDYLKIA
jgi:teichoic acid transport system ATP-binding protein